MSDNTFRFSTPTHDDINRLNKLWKCSRTGELVPEKHCVICGNQATSFEALTPYEREFLQVDQAIMNIKELERQFEVNEELTQAYNIIDLIDQASTLMAIIHGELKRVKLNDCMTDEARESVDETITPLLKNLRRGVKSAIDTGKLEQNIRTYIEERDG